MRDQMLGTVTPKKPFFIATDYWRSIVRLKFDPIGCKCTLPYSCRVTLHGPVFILLESVCVTADEMQAVVSKRTKDLLHKTHLCVRSNS